MKDFIITLLHRMVRSKKSIDPLNIIHWSVYPERKEPMMNSEMRRAKERLEVFLGRPIPSQEQLEDTLNEVMDRIDNEYRLIDDLLPRN